MLALRATKGHLSVYTVLGCRKLGNCKKLKRGHWRNIRTWCETGSEATSAHIEQSDTKTVSVIRIVFRKSSRCSNKIGDGYSEGHHYPFVII